MKQIKRRILRFGARMLEGFPGDSGMKLPIDTCADGTGSFSLHEEKMIAGQFERLSAWHASIYIENKQDRFDWELPV
jgi:hypothetical protein